VDQALVFLCQKKSVEKDYPILKGGRGGVTHPIGTKKEKHPIAEEWGATNHGD